MKLNFTTRVLGTKAAARLRQHQVTQTIRSTTSSITQAVLSGSLKTGDPVEVTLDSEMLGLAEYVCGNKTNFDALIIDDARRGGFDSISELALVLKRAGYRFKDLTEYEFYRFQFSWLEEDIEKMRGRLLW